MDKFLSGDKFSPGPCRPTLSRHDWRMISLQRSRSLFAHWYNLSDLAAECPTPGLIPAYRLETLARSVSTNNHWLEIALDALRTLELVEPREGGALWMTHFPRPSELVETKPEEDVSLAHDWRLDLTPAARRKRKQRQKEKAQGVSAKRDNGGIVTPSSVTDSVTSAENVTPEGVTQSVTDAAKSADLGVTAAPNVTDFGVTSPASGVTPSRTRQSPKEINRVDRLIPEKIVDDLTDAGANVTRNVTAQSVTSSASTINDSSEKGDKTSFSSSEMKPSPAVSSSAVGSSSAAASPVAFRADVVQKMVDATKAEHNRPRYAQFFDMANKAGEWQLANQALRQLKKRLDDKTRPVVRDIPAYFDKILVGLIENIDARFAASRVKQQEIRAELGLAADASQYEVRTAIRASMGFGAEVEASDAL